MKKIIEILLLLVMVCIVAMAVGFHREQGA